MCGCVCVSGEQTGRYFDFAIMFVVMGHQLYDTFRNIIHIEYRRISVEARRVE